MWAACLHEDHLVKVSILHMCPGLQQNARHRRPTCRSAACLYMQYRTLLLQIQYDTMSGQLQCTKWDSSAILSMISVVEGHKLWHNAYKHMQT